MKARVYLGNLEKPGREQWCGLSAAWESVRKSSVPLCSTREGITLEVWPLEFCTWTWPILICINIYKWPGKSPTLIAASLLSKCILLSYPFLFPVVVSGMRFSCCCSCQQHYLEINITVACVYINREWRTCEVQFTFVKMLPDAGMVNINIF